jgi:hypothetical protein
MKQLGLSALLVTLMGGAGCTLVVDTDVDPGRPDQGLSEDAGGSDLGVGDVGVLDAGGPMDLGSDAGVACMAPTDCTQAGLADHLCPSGTCVPDPKWACVGDVEPPMPGSGRRAWRQRYVEINSGEVPSDLTASLCRITDVECANPIAQDLRPDRNGVLSYLVPEGFEGYVVLTSTAIEPAVVHLSGPVVEDTPDEEILTFRLLFNGAPQLFANLLRLQLEPDTVIAIISSLGCDQRQAAGSTVETTTQTSSTSIVYVGNDLPDPSLSATTENGNVALINHPTGITTVRVRREGYTEPVAERRANFRPGAIHYMALPPTP